jgi:hypothetical protein
MVLAADRRHDRVPGPAVLLGIAAERENDAAGLELVERGEECFVQLGRWLVDPGFFKECCSRAGSCW